MVFGTNADFIRVYNRRVILNLVRGSGPISRSDVARHTGLSLQAVSTIFSELQEEGWITSRGRRTSSRGQPPVDYELNAEGAYSLGIVLDLDGIYGVIGNLSGTIIAEKKKLIQKVSPGQAVSIMLSLTNELLARVDETQVRVLGLGVAIPGTPDPTTEKIITLPHMAGWEGFPLKPTLSKHLNFPVYVANDATVTALGESWFGDSRHAKDFFYVFFAHGLNGTLVADQQPYGGIWGVTGKFGHIPVEPNGRACPGCGGQGCLEQYASFLALARVLNSSVLTEEMLVQRLKENDPELRAWLEDAGRHLVTALLTVENLFDPERIVFGGRMPKPILEALLDLVHAALPQRRMKIKPRHPVLVISELSAKAALIGAFSLPLHQAVLPNVELVHQDLGRG